MNLTAIQLKLARIAFLTETAQHFNDTNRGVRPGPGCGCTYVNGCAIGRKIPHELAVKLDNNIDDPSVSNRDVFNQLPDELKQLGRIFLSCVQGLHDDANNWDAKGLTERGWNYYNSIVRRVLEDGCGDA